LYDSALLPPLFPQDAIKSAVPTNNPKYFIATNLNVFINF